MKSYYQNLSEEELLKRREQLWKMYLAPVIAWLTAFVIIVLSAGMEIPLLLLFSGSVFATIIALVADYRNRYKIISEVLENH